MAWLGRTWRVRANQILTAVGLRSKGFYTPYDYMESVKCTTSTYDRIEELFSKQKGSFVQFLKDIDTHQSRFIELNTGVSRVRWDTRWISRLDGAAIYTYIANTRPQRLIEVGSGTSTAFICQSIQDGGISCDVTCIDPAPRSDIADLNVTFRRRPLSLDDIPAMVALGAGDVLFIDSSHIMQQGFDVDILFNRVFPDLQPGVVVHIHDIFLPFPYPPNWAVFRFNEQNALIPWLLSGHFAVDFASHYVWERMRDELRAICASFPLDTPKNGGSLWIRKI